MFNRQKHQSIDATVLGACSPEVDGTTNPAIGAPAGPNSNTLEGSRLEEVLDIPPLEPPPPPPPTDEDIYLERLVHYTRNVVRDAPKEKPVTLVVASKAWTGIMSSFQSTRGNFIAAETTSPAAVAVLVGAADLDSQRYGIKAPEVVEIVGTFLETHVLVLALLRYDNIRNSASAKALDALAAEENISIVHYAGTSTDFSWDWFMWSRFDADDDGRTLKSRIKQVVLGKAREKTKALFAGMLAGSTAISMDVFPRSQGEVHLAVTADAELLTAEITIDHDFRSGGFEISLSELGKIVDMQVRSGETTFMGSLSQEEPIYTHVDTTTHITGYRYVSRSVSFPDNEAAGILLALASCSRPK